MPIKVDEVLTVEEVKRNLKLVEAEVTSMTAPQVKVVQLDAPMTKIMPMQVSTVVTSCDCCRMC